MANKRFKYKKKCFYTCLSFYSGGRHTWLGGMRGWGACFGGCAAVSAVWVVNTLIGDGDTQTLMAKIEFVLFLYSEVVGILKLCLRALTPEPSSETFIT